MLAGVLQRGSCQAETALPKDLRRVFVVSGDVAPLDHVRMQAAVQAFVDNSISKTINFPAGATEDQVAEAYFKAWELGCKGLTVYVTGSRDKVVLETRKVPGDTAAADRLTGRRPAKNRRRKRGR